MQKWTGVLLLGAAVLIGARSAAAQEAGDVGLTTGFPAAIGAIWHLTDAVAIRPEINFSHNNLDTSVSSGSSSTSVGFSVSGLLYVSHDDRLRTYVAPRLDYSHVSASSDGVVSLSTDRNTWGGSGSFGVQYAVGDKFSIFGEAGLAYTRAHTPSTSTQGVASAEFTQTAFGTRTAVGVIFYPGR